MSKVSLKQLNAPCIVYNLNGYYDSLKAMLKHMIDMGLSSEERQKGIYFAESLEQITDILCSLKEDKQKPDSNIGIEIKATATDSLSPFRSKS